jgi:hypothetical protein
MGYADFFRDACCLLRRSGGVGKNGANTVFFVLTHFPITPWYPGGCWGKKWRGLFSQKGGVVVYAVVITIRI